MASPISSSEKPTPFFGNLPDGRPPVAEGGGVTSLWRPLTRPWWWQRISVRVVLAFLLVSALPPLTLGVLTMRSARVAQLREVRDRNTAVAVWGVDKVQSYLENILENMRLTIELGEFQHLNPAAIKPFLSYLLSYMEGVKEISLLDTRGQERVRIAEHSLITQDDLTNRASEPVFRVPVGGETYIGPVRTSEFSEPFINLALPIRSLGEDRVVGVLAAEVNLKRLWDEVLSFRVGQGGYLFLVDAKGKLLAHPDFSLVLAGRDMSGDAAVRRFLQIPEGTAPVEALEYANFQGVQVVGVHARSSKLGWGVIVEQPTADAFNNVSRMRIETTIILFNAIVVTMVLATIWARGLTGPLAALAQGARLLGAGNFSHRIPVQSRDEIAEVAERFNAMAEQLQGAFQRLHTLLETSAMTSSSLELEEVLTAALEQLDLLTGQAQSGIALLDGSGDERRRGVTVRSLHPAIGTRSLALTIAGHPNLWKAVSGARSALLEDVASEAGADEQALWAPQRAGSILVLPLSSRGEVLGALWVGRAEVGRFEDEEVALAQTVANQVAVAIHNARFFGALRRTSEELESRVEERTRELREAHEELVRKERLALVGQLAGGVGHELRNPLGAIGNTAYYLRMRLGQAADAKVQKHLEILEGEVRRANKIVTDLLDFSRVKQPNRMAAQLNSIIADVLSRQPRPEAIPVILDLADPLPTVQVDPDQVGQVLLNLILNGIEAMPNGGTLTIRTAAERGDVVAQVSDSGTGIEPENLEKIFQPLFTTKTKGIGLGLAVSRRLAEANGGRLVVSSRPGAGSTFTLAFPPAGREEARV